MTEQEVKEYQAFMWTPVNAYACEKCPENKNDGWNKLPCGQQNCWVVCHTETYRRGKDES